MDARAVARVDDAPPGREGVEVKNAEITEALNKRRECQIMVWFIKYGREGERKTYTSTLVLSAALTPRAAMAKKIVAYENFILISSGSIL